MSKTTFENEGKEILQEMLVKYTDWVNGDSVAWNVEKEKGIQAIVQLHQQETLKEKINVAQDINFSSNPLRASELLDLLILEETLLVTRTNLNNTKGATDE